MRAVFVVGFSRLASARYSTHRQSAPLARWEKGWGVKAVFVVGFGTLAGARYSTCGEALRVAQGTSPYGGPFVICWRGLCSCEELYRQVF